MVGLRSSPPPSATVLEQWSLADYSGLQPLRASLRRVLSVHVVREEDLEDVAERMTIVATELATNALHHAKSPALVQLSRTTSSFILDVADDRPDQPPQIADREPGAGGLGLKFTQELAADTGWYVANSTKHVWAQFSTGRRARRFNTPRISVFDLRTLVKRLRRLGT